MAVAAFVVGAVVREHDGGAYGERRDRDDREQNELLHAESFRLGVLRTPATPRGAETHAGGGYALEDLGVGVEVRVHRVDVVVVLERVDQAHQLAGRAPRRPATRVFGRRPISADSSSTPAASSASRTA